MTTETAREEAVNPLLGQLLRARGINARAERRSRGDAPDIRFELRTGELVLIECKWESNRVALDAQLDQRVHDFPDAVARVGVLYHDGLKHVDDIHDELEHTLNLQWYLHSSRDKVFEDQTLREGTIEQFADHLRLLPLEIEGVDRVVAAAGAVGYSLDQAASELRKHARAARLIADAIAETDDEKDKAAAQRIGCLVLFNALAFQDRLASIRDDVPSLNEVSGDDTAKLEAAWRAICDEIDYVPVFELAADLAKILGYAPAPVPRLVLRPLLRAVEQTRLVEGHDLSGRLFHTLLSDAKFTGLPTTPQSPPRPCWRGSSSRTGRPMSTGPTTSSPPRSPSPTSPVAPEPCSWPSPPRPSADMKPPAARSRPSCTRRWSSRRCTATTCSSPPSTSPPPASPCSIPQIEFDRMNLYVMDYGAEDGKAALGSLDFLLDDEVPVQLALSPTQSLGAERVTGEGPQGVEAGVTAKLPELDLAIMNPPFTRSVVGNMLFGSLPSSDRAKLRKELAKRLKSRYATVTAGLGAAFVAAAAPKLRAGEGRLALVLPISVCTGASWQQTRSLIERDFTLDTVIVSHDPTRWNFIR